MFFSFKRNRKQYLCFKIAFLKMVYWNSLSSLLCLADFEWKYLSIFFQRKCKYKSFFLTAHFNKNKVKKHFRSQSYQTFIFPVFQFSLLSLSVCKKNCLVGLTPGQTFNIVSNVVLDLWVFGFLIFWFSDFFNPWKSQFGNSLFQWTQFNDLSFNFSLFILTRGLYSDNQEDFVLHLCKHFFF